MDEDLNLEEDESDESDQEAQEESEDEYFDSPRNETATKGGYESKFDFKLQ
jgi:hypothetical protein